MSNSIHHPPKISKIGKKTYICFISELISSQIILKEQQQHIQNHSTEFRAHLVRSHEGRLAKSVIVTVISSITSKKIRKVGKTEKN